MPYQKWDLKKAQELAASRGGEFLSDIFFTSREKYRWRCANRHEWEAALANVAKQVKRLDPQIVFDKYIEAVKSKKLETKISAINKNIYQEMFNKSVEKSTKKAA